MCTVVDVPRPPPLLLRLFVTVSDFPTILPLIVYACRPEDSDGAQPIRAC